MSLAIQLPRSLPPERLSATSVVIVNVSPFNHPPLALSDAITTDEDSSITIPDLLNDLDVHLTPEGDTWTVSALVTLQNGSFSTDGKTIVYRLAAHFNGVDAFSYWIRQQIKRR